jgi:hypothetical protein
MEYNSTIIMSSFEAFFYPPFLESLSGEFSPPQFAGAPYSVRTLAFDAIQHRLARPERELTHGDTLLTYRHNLDKCKNIEVGVDAKIVNDFPRIHIVFLYDDSATAGNPNELIISADEPNCTVDFGDIRYRLTLEDELLVARTAIAAAAQDFFDKANH